MKVYQQHIELLGYKAKDKITGYEGVIESICFDLYGCIQASLRPPVDNKGEVPQGYWFDVTRLKISTSKRVVGLPDFERGYVAEGNRGPANKPTQKA